MSNGSIVETFQANCEQSTEGFRKLLECRIQGDAQKAMRLGIEVGPHVSGCVAHASELGHCLTEHGHLLRDCRYPSF